MSDKVTSRSLLVSSQILVLYMSNLDGIVSYMESNISHILCHISYPTLPQCNKHTLIVSFYTFWRIIYPSCIFENGSINYYMYDFFRKENFERFIWIMQVTLEVKGEPQILNLSEKLTAGGILHRLWIEQPENIPTCLATKPYPKSLVSPFFRKLKLCKWLTSNMIQSKMYVFIFRNLEFEILQFDPMPDVCLRFKKAKTLNALLLWNGVSHLKCESQFLPVKIACWHRKCTCYETPYAEKIFFFRRIKH